MSEEMIINCQECGKEETPLTTIAFVEGSSIARTKVLCKECTANFLANKEEMTPEDLAELEDK